MVARRGWGRTCQLSGPIGAQLSGPTLRGQLSEANLSGANSRGPSSRGPTLANSRGQSLGANSRGPISQGAKLSGANSRRPISRGTLWGQSLTLGANLWGPSSRGPISRPRDYYLQSIFSTLISSAQQMDILLTSFGQYAPPNKWEIKQRSSPKLSILTDAQIAGLASILRRLRGCAKTTRAISGEC